MHAVVTGANRGLGLATAEGLARRGLQVVLACRSEERGLRAQEQVRAAAGHDRVWFMPLDLAEPESVCRFAEAYGERFGRLHVLVNNAGIIPTKLSRSSLGVELGWHVQYLGHYQLTRLLLPVLRASAPARIVTVVGTYAGRGTLELHDLGWQERRWRWIQAAADGQLARALFAVELAARLRGTGVTSNSVHPGAVHTGAHRDFPLYLRVLAEPISRLFFASPDKGAQTLLRLADDPDLTEVSGQWFRRFEPAVPSPRIHDEAARQALWRRSAELLGPARLA